MKIKNKDRKADKHQQLKNSKLLPCHQKALLKCRDYLQQTLKPDIFKNFQLKERTSSFSKFSSVSSTTPQSLTVPLNSDFQQKDSDNKPERISLFLDQLEVSDEKTFANFMDTLKDHNKSVHKILEKTIKLFELEETNDDEFDDDFRELGETSSLSGRTILEILKQQKLRNSMQSVEDDNVLQNINEHSIHLFDNVFDEKDYHLNCFVVASRPEHYNRPWIKHDNNRRKLVPSTDNSNKPYMAEVIKDVVFKTIERLSLPSNVKKPPENVEKIFIFDEQNIYSPVANEKDDRYARKYEMRERYGLKKCSSSRIKNVNATTSNPPPLPPKPDILTPAPIVKTREKNKCNVNRNINNINNNNNLQLANTNTQDVAPPIPIRQKTDFFSKPPPALPVSLSARESLKSNESPKLWPEDKHLSNGHVISDEADEYDGNDDNDVVDDEDDVDNDEEEEDEDDENNLNRFVELEDSDEMEEPYEPITPMLPARKQIIKNDFCTNGVNDDHKKETFVNVDDGGNVISSTNPDHDHEVSKSTDEKCQSENIDENTNNLESVENCQNDKTVENNYIDVVDSKTPICLTDGSLTTDNKETANKIQANELNEKQESQIIDDKSVAFPPATNKIDRPNEKISEGSIETLTTTTVSVSRSSSGVSATVSDQTTARDSGVDSTISHSLHDSPFCVSDLVEDLDTVIPNSSTFANNEKLGSLGRHNDTSYYEDIDSMNPRDSTYTSHYLDPRTETQIIQEKVKSNTDQKVVPAGTLLLCDSVPALLSTDFSEILEQDTAANKNNNETVQNLKEFSNTYMAYDKEGYVYYVPKDCLKIQGDPKNEPWFFPKPISVKEATIFLNQERQRGCFVVYTPYENTNKGVLDECTYYLSVCENNEGDVYHYPIVENARGDITIEGSDRSFLSISELVSFYKKNRENLITRLRRPLKESKLAIMPGYHYPLHFEVSKKSIRLFGEVISKSKFGVTCKGNYGHQMVLVKALQHYLVIENEDDFLEEALTLMKLNHENIAKLLGVCFKTRPYYIIMENLNCGTLKDALSNGVIQLGHPEIQFDICLQIISAMVYLEKLHFLLHRNLKSSNFLISSDYTIKLFNFEKAKHVDDDCYRASPVEEISVRWAAPEVFLYSLHSTKSDVWSTGVVLWEIFSFGQIPYGQLSESEVVVYVTEKGKLEKPVECDNRMFSIISQCWKCKPEMRPSFQVLENKLKSQYNVHYDSNARLRSTSETPPISTARSDANWPDNSKANSLILPVKPSKRHSHSGPATPRMLTPSLQIKNNTLQTCENDTKIDDIMRSLNTNSKLTNRSTYLLNSRQTANFETSSANVPYTQAINGECRDNKIRKSIRNFLKKGNLNIKNSD